MEHRMEYIKLFWKHNYPDDPVVIIYEVDLDDERYAIRLIDIYADGHTNNMEDRAWGYVTEAPVPTIEIFNTNDYGEDFHACLISKEEFEEIWNTGIYTGDLIFQQDGNGMGKQINYYIGYEDFLKVAEQAIKNGCVILKKEYGKYVRSNDIGIISQDCNRYYFYLPEAGDLETQTHDENEFIGGYNSSGNVVIEASYSIVKHEQKTISRGRLFSVTGYYDENKNWIDRPECMKKLYDKLVRVVKKTAPYTEIVDEIVSTSSDDYLKPKEWKHKEYITEELLALKEKEDYKLVI